MPDPQDAKIKNWEKTAVVKPQNVEAVRQIMREAASAEQADTKQATATPERATRLEMARAAVADTVRDNTDDTVVDRDADIPTKTLLDARVHLRGEPPAAARSQYKETPAAPPFKTQYTRATESGQTIDLHEFASTQAAHDHYAAQLDTLNSAGLGEKIFNWRQRSKKRTTLRESLAELRTMLAQEATAVEQQKKIG